MMDTKFVSDRYAKERRAGKLRTKVLLRFTPANGKQRKILRKSITVTFG